MAIPREINLLVSIISNIREKMRDITKEELSYIAGFVDGDGCILAQIVSRKDYKHNFQIRVSVILYQKSIRH